MVEILVYQPTYAPRKVFADKKVPLKALAAVSPVIHDAIVTNNQTTGAHITALLLPYGDLSAYKDIMGWILDIIAAGKILRLRKIYQSPLLRYDRIQHIAVKLGIGFLKMGMNNRITNMLSKATESGFAIALEEVEWIYSKLSDKHPLRDLVSKALVVANHNHCLDPQFCTDLVAMTPKLPALAHDLCSYSNYLHSGTQYAGGYVDGDHTAAAATTPELAPDGDTADTAFLVVGGDS